MRGRSHVHVGSGRLSAARPPTQVPFDSRLLPASWHRRKRYWFMNHDNARLLCRICYRDFSGASAYCSVECRSRAAVDRLHWDCAIKYAFKLGWIPLLNSPFSLAVPDPLDRYRIDRLTLFQKNGAGWQEAGWVGCDFVPGIGATVDHCMHAPWPDGEFSQLRYPVAPRLVDELSRIQIDDYCEAIRARQSESIETYASSIVRSGGNHEFVMFDQVRRANPPPVLSSWIATNEEGG